jgi:enoyl-CoA hydratase/carnithine racemase
MSISYEITGSTAVIRFDRAAKLNALTLAMYQDLGRAFKEAGADDRVRAIGLTGAGDRAFCVGADLKERNGFSEADLRAQRPHFRAAFGGILDLPVPSIAAVHGFALGGGLELALSCDLIVCDETAVLGLPEVTVGVIPGGGGTQLLTRRIGSSRAADLVFTARRLDVAEAERIGLADRRVPAGTDREAALELAGTIAGNSPVGVRNAKRALRQGADVDLATGLEVEDGAWRATAFSGDRAEGVAAFNEKRRPNWPGK